jgi:signal transduction histidine kinase
MHYPFFRALLFTLSFTIISLTSISGQGIDAIKGLIREAQRWNPSIERDSALAFGFNYMAEAYSGHQDSLALLYIDSIKQLLRSTHRWNKTEGLYYRAQGKYHDRRGEFESALDYYSRAIDSFEKNGDQSELVAYTYILKAFVLNNNGLQEACRQTLEQIRPLAEKLPNKNYLAWILDAYGDHYFYSSFGQVNYPKALEYYLQVEKILPQVSNMMVKADNAHGLAGCYVRLGDEEKTTYYRNLALEIARENGLHSVIFAVYGDMADVYEERGNYPEAIRYRLLGIEYARQTNWIEMEARAHGTIAYTYKQAGDYQNALHHFEILKNIEDSLSRFDVQARYNELEARYESGKKDLQIQQLKARNLSMGINVLLALLTGGFLFLLYYKKTNKKLVRQNTELARKNLEIQMALTEGQNIERKRMAIELHDNINAKIAAAKWVLETINTPDKSDEEQNVINRLVDTMSDIYEDVRFISHNLVPRDMETKSLSTIVRQLIENLNHNQKITFSLDLQGTEPHLDISLKLHLYAMIMELINNVIRHSECKNASVVLSFDTHNCSLTVQDDGRGFDPSAVQSGTGLKNLISRISSVKGKLDIAANAAGGSVIQIEVPIPAIQDNVTARPASTDAA